MVKDAENKKFDLIEGKNSCNVGRVKEETIKSLFVRAFNRLYTDRAKLLDEYKLRLEREKFTEIDQERIAKLDEDIESLILQERALFFIEKNADLKTEHKKLVGRLTLITLLGSLAQEESSNISQITRMGIAYRFQEGKVIVNHNRFLGYTKDENGELAIVQEEAEIIKRICSWRYRWNLKDEQTCGVIHRQAEVPSRANMPSQGSCSVFDEEIFRRLVVWIKG